MEKILPFRIFIWKKKLFKNMVQKLHPLIEIQYCLFGWFKNDYFHFNWMFSKSWNIIFLIFPVFSKPQLLENTLQFSTKPYTK